MGNKSEIKQTRKTIIEAYRLLFLKMNHGSYLAEVLYDDNGIPYDYKYFDCNKVFEESVGLNRDQIIGKTYNDIVPPDPESGWPDCFKRVALTGKPETFLFYSNIYKCYFDTYAFMLSEDMFAVIVTDVTNQIKAESELIKYKEHLEELVTERTNKLDQINSDLLKEIKQRKKTEKELIIAKQKAEESYRLKTAFLQNMSHEIRTPMNAIMGFSDLLVNSFDNKVKFKKYSEIIGQRCNDLLAIINDILDIAKIESMQLSINNNEFYLSELFDELSSFFSEYQKRIGKEHITLNIKTLCDQSENVIITDMVKLKQIFVNLITNAFKFTNSGSIEVGCKYDKNNKLVFYVSDTGIGIPVDKQKLVFERFVQLQQDSKKIIGGTGLGLSIVKGLLDLLGGEIFLESEPNKGSTFSFTIPFKTEKSKQQEQVVIETFNNKNFINKTILIVEDDIYNSEYLTEILSGIGLNIIQAENGKGAIKIAISQPVDLVLMDVRLPDINGYDATLQIRKHKPHLKIVAQTAYVSLNEKQKALDAGCIDYISKPIQKNSLLALLNKHFS
jgi:signal transduction histidine kinase